METPPSFLELSTMEMVEGQKFEDYATNWHSEAAKHFPPICEAQQIQMFHGTLKGAYYFHLMGHKSTFSEMIMVGKQVDLGIKLESHSRAPGILTVLGELHTYATCHSRICSVDCTLSVSTPRSTSLLLSSVGPATNCPPLPPYFDPTVQAPGFESSSAGTANPSHAGSTERYDAIPAAHTVHAFAYPTLPHI
ncbi:hypothetical protein CRG98_022598 [Punica granatum]|uniref:Uncharacterized protein n=1 Tax=Punica granatum TaxID=22663 RepID=A0A2I0JLD7_PUNGR|nr:hypothetical protein CRG98_022598 [Punica granatum]